jgi:serine/threonine protein kinase
LDSQLAHLLSSLLNKDPLKRITLAAILVHPWILKISDKLDLTDLVNPAFLSNKKLVESLVDCKYPE